MSFTKKNGGSVTGAFFCARGEARLFGHCSVEGHCSLFGVGVYNNVHVMCHEKYEKCFISNVLFVLNSCKHINTSSLFFLQPGGFNQTLENGVQRIGKERIDIIGSLREGWIRAIFFATKLLKKSSPDS